MEFLRNYKSRKNKTKNDSSTEVVSVGFPKISFIVNTQTSLLNNDKDYKKLAIALLTRLDENKIKEALDLLKEYHFEIFQGVIVEFKKLEDNLARNAIKTKIFDDFIDTYNTAKLSLSVGDQLAFLIGRYVMVTNREVDCLSGLFSYLKKWIASHISQGLLALQTIIEANNTISLHNAFHLFFIYERNKAERLFRKTLSENRHKNRHNDNEVLHYYLLKDAIFHRVNLNYLPKIEVTPNAPESIKLSSQENSISEQELLKIIDNEDNFNINLPLAKLASGSFINPHQDIENYNELIRLLNVLFRTQIQNSDMQNKEFYLSFEVGEVFVDNICSKFGNHSKQMFIDARELIKKLLVSDEAFKLKFFKLLYELKEWKFLSKWNTKFPPLMSSYLGNIKGFSKSTLKDFFRNNEKNPIFNSDFDVISFIKENSNISL